MRELDFINSYQSFSAQCVEFAIYSQNGVLTLYCLNSFFRSFLGHIPMIGSFRLPTHSRDAHRNFFFYDPFLN